MTMLTPEHSDMAGLRGALAHGRPDRDGQQIDDDRDKGPTRGGRLREHKYGRYGDTIAALEFYNRRHTSFRVACYFWLSSTWRIVDFGGVVMGVFLLDGQIPFVLFPS